MDSGFDMILGLKHWKGASAMAKPIQSLVENQRISTFHLKKQPGFTLVELLVVVVIVSILTAIVVPTIDYFGDQAKLTAAQTSVRAIQKQIDIHKIKTGNYATTFQVKWFRGYKIPKSPYGLGNGNPVFYTSKLNKRHPTFKEINSRTPYWYNSMTGLVRIRVPVQASDAETLELYNAANSSSIPDLNYTGLP